MQDALVCDPNIPLLGNQRPRLGSATLIEKYRRDIPVARIRVKRKDVADLRHVYVFERQYGLNHIGVTDLWRVYVFKRISAPYVWPVDSQQT